jgi:hypothetical protein
MQVFNTENGISANDNTVDGNGVHINDGNIQETINFFPQQIVFVNSNVVVNYNTTLLSFYRLIGQGNQIQLYVRSANDTTWNKLASVGCFTYGTNEGNGYTPNSFVDS